MSIAYPVYHRNKITKKKVMLLFAVTSGFNALVVALSFFLKGLTDTYITVVAPLSIALVTAAYIKIFLVASKRGNVLLVNVAQVNDENAGSTNRLVKRALLRDFKIAKACLLVVVCFFVCLLPGPLSYVFLKENDFTQNVVVVWTISLVFLNSSLNCSIFFWKRPMLRQEAKKTLRSISCFTTF